MSARLHFFGAAGCVTGACALIETDHAKVLVDCGLFQGPKTLKALNYERFPFSPEAIAAVLLTHAHIDHSGLIPKLALQGFNGPIYATAGTIELCRVMLPDAGAIQEMEVEALNRRNQRRGGEAVTPIYTKADAEEAMRLFRSTPLKAWREIAPGVRAQWWNAGHILGAASIEIELSEGGTTQRLCFSGDIGPGGREYADDPEGPMGVDHLIVESTYGDVERRMVGQVERRKTLAEEMRAAHAAGGPLLIPAFAVERTQELIVDLLELMEANEAPPGQIFLDSPLAIRASEVFLEHGRLDDGDHPFARLRQSRWLQYTESVGESRAIERFKGWHVIIAASGMCDAGRVRHHLRRLLWREEATVLIVGFQAIGTLGRLLQEGRQRVRIQGDEIKVRARVRSLDVYSGHADANGLVNWVKARGPIGGSIFLAHGEPQNLTGLKRRLIAADAVDGKILVAELDQSYRLRAAQTGEPERGAAPRLEPKNVSRLDWHNARAEFLSALQEKLEEAADDATREAILHDLKERL
ncbi:MAG: MBL fold metallo-hydrolase [Hyphomonadaceae bacterium]|nr:MBL fold metallo-hydrolase [Hyphomonadaceae bacterium]